MPSLDLHHLTWAEAREELVRACNERADSGRALVLDVIHGYGKSGVGGRLRLAVRTFLSQNGIPFVEGERHDGNPGHTLVTLGRPLPDAADRLSRAIHAYCANGRTRSELDGQFRRHGRRAVDEALKSLRAENRIAAVVINGRRKYRSL